MGIITLYVIWEVLKVFAFTLGGMTLLLTLGMGAREAVFAGVPPQVVAMTTPFMLPEMLGITMPVSMLLAVTSVFGRMAGTNEIVALKALGISPLRVIEPVLVLALVLSFLTVQMYEWSATWGRPSVQRVIATSVEDIAYGMLRNQRSYQAPGFSIAVRAVEGRKLIHPVIMIAGRGGNPPVTFTADVAELRSDLSSGVIRVLCDEGQLEVSGLMKLSYGNDAEFKIPIDLPGRPVHRDWLGQGEIPEHVAAFRAQAEQIRKRLREQGSLLPEEEARSERESLDHYESKVFRLKTEPYRRWSNGFSCLCFALVGVPVTMLRRSENFLTSFFVCFLPILGVYYPLLMVGEDLTTSGALPPVFFWMGNGVLAVAGFWLLNRALR